MINYVKDKNSWISKYFSSFIIYLKFLRYVIMSSNLIFVEMFLKPTKNYFFFSYNNRLLERPFKIYLIKLITNNIHI